MAPDRPGCTCDIVLQKRALGRRRWGTVNRRHCLLGTTQDRRVVVKPSSEGTNRTKVNRVRVLSGVVELGPGDVLRLGKARLVALSQRMLEAEQPPKPKITASDPGEYLTRSKDVYGSVNKVAKRFNIARATLSRWLRLGRFDDDG